MHWKKEGSEYSRQKGSPVQRSCGWGVGSPLEAKRWHLKRAELFSLIRPGRLMVHGHWHLVEGDACGAKRSCPSVPVSIS